MRFSEAVKSNIRSQHNAGWYADYIGVSIQHLTRVVKACLGITPKAYIDNILIGELRNVISSTMLSFKEIAFEFGFDDCDALGRFFKRNVGRTLFEWRAG